MPSPFRINWITHLSSSSSAKETVMRKTSLVALTLTLAVQSAIVLAQQNGAAVPPASSAPANAQTPIVKAPDTRGTPDERAWQLVKQMTIEEKVRMLSGAPNGFATMPV